MPVGTVRFEVLAGAPLSCIRYVTMWRNSARSLPSAACKGI